MTTGYDTEARAEQAMREAGFITDFSKEMIQEAETLIARHNRDPRGNTPDYSKLLWSSIDNEDSRDLDQLEYAERLDGDRLRLRLAIADVAELIPQNSLIDKRAAHNTSSIYTGVRTFPMLPPNLSEGKTSLLPGGKKRAIVITMDMEADGELSKVTVEEALVQNQIRLSYDEAADYFDRQEMSGVIASNPLMDEQLDLQLEISRRLINLRKNKGALTFSSVEPRPVKKDGKLVDLKVSRHNTARDVIESFMIAANIGAAMFLKSKGWPIIERVVQAPRRWDRIRQIASRYNFSLPPEADTDLLSKFLIERRKADPDRFGNLSMSIVKLLGAGEYVVEYPDGPQRNHFALAVDDYSHSTAPNRRYSDLVLQRLIKAAIADEPIPYTAAELEEAAKRCTRMEDAARKVERLMRKVIAAQMLSQRIGQRFDGIVTGASVKGTYVRLLGWPAEGRIVKGETGIDVGDKVKVQLIKADPQSGFIDFMRL
ncbi:MAG: RNB domain-containing ribonuclease [Verrucomicrobiales bacterium]